MSHPIGGATSALTHRIDTRHHAAPHGSQRLRDVRHTLCGHNTCAIVWRSLFRVLTLWLLMGLLGMVCHVSAYQRYQSNIPNGGGISRNGVPWPGLGHNAPGGDGSRNSFGIAFASAGRSFTRDLCMADTDGDGYRNGEELGDPNCTWSPGNTPARTTGLSHPGYADSTPPSTNDSSISRAAIIGIAVGGGVAVLIVIAIVVVFLHQRKGQIVHPQPPALVGAAATTDTTA